LPQPLCHRGQLPAVAAGADKDEHAGAVVATAVCRSGADPAQCVGVAALGGVGPPAPGGATPGSGPAAVPGHVTLAATPGRGSVRGVRPSNGRTPHPNMT